MPKKMPTHYTEIIREYFNERITRNVQYSLRAFARDLEMPASHLSEVFKGKSNISLKKAEFISEKLNLSADDHKLFIQLVEISLANEEEKESLEKSLLNYDSSYVKISNDTYSDISEWHNLTFLELLCLDDFKYDHQWIAKRLGITFEESQKMVDDLIRANLIIEEKGTLKKNYDFYVLPKGNGSSSARNLHNEVLRKASASLAKDSSDKRDFSSTFIHIKKDDLSEITEKIKNFRRQLVKEYEGRQGQDSVHMLSIQLFRADLEDTSTI